MVTTSFVQWIYWLWNKKSSTNLKHPETLQNQASDAETWVQHSAAIQSNLASCLRQENVLLTNWMSKGLRDVADRPVRLAENLHLTDELIYALLVSSPSWVNPGRSVVKVWNGAEHPEFAASKDVWKFYCILKFYCALERLRRLEVRRDIWDICLRFANSGGELQTGRGDWCLGACLQLA